MTDTEKTIAKLRRYASCKEEHYQVINCADIRVLLDEIERLNDLICADCTDLYTGE